nr:MAG TPA: Lower collar protein [Caudoviricetes sp.]
MANYTMEIREMMNDPLIGLFTFDYDFYSDNPHDREEFEKLFSQWYYYREIGFETPHHFKVKLQAKLNLIMPYYRQLALTEWDKVRTIEQMMESKNLTETTEHTQELTGNNKNMTQGTNHTTTNDTTTSEQSSKQSNLSDGVSQSSLSEGYLTGVGETSITNGNNGSTNVTLNQSTVSDHGQTLTETTTFKSSGDIGIQTPSYAIAEWRKVLINLNQLIIDECNDLFMKIY